MNRYILYAILLLNPSVNFGLISAEVFPWAIIIFVLLLNKINKYILFISILILSHTTLYILLDGIPPDLFRSILAYINALLSMSIVLTHNKIRDSLLIISNKYLYILLIVGVLQSLGVINFLDPIFNLFVPRSSTESLSGSGRGVTLLSTEPARAGIELLLLYAFIKVVHNKNNNYTLPYDIIIFIYLIIIFKSVIVSILAVIYMSSLYLKLKYIPYIITIAVIFNVIIIYLIPNTRIGKLADDIYKTSNITEINEILLNESGNRLTTVYAFYPYGVKSIIGSGIGNWEKSSVEAIQTSGMDVTNYNFFKDGDLSTRGSGFMTNLILDLGIIAIIIYILIIYVINKNYLKSRETNSLILLFILTTTIFGSVGTTNNWVLCFSALIINKKYNTKKI